MSAGGVAAALQMQRRGPTTVAPQIRENTGGMTQAQILAKRDDYFSSVEAGKPAYSDTELYGVEWIPAN